MKDSTLLKISLAVSVTGIFIILYLVEFQNRLPDNLNEITKDQLDSLIKVEGEVTKVTKTPGLLILNIKDNTGTTEVIAFTSQESLIEKGMKVEVTGRVQEYQNKLEIIADEIKIT
jgi:DNA/RNA endonuclease YhcR with UshA esterase domain